MNLVRINQQAQVGGLVEVVCKSAITEGSLQVGGLYISSEYLPTQNNPEVFQFIGQDTLGNCLFKHSLDGEGGWAYITMGSWFIKTLDLASIN